MDVANLMIVLARGIPLMVIVCRDSRDLNVLGKYSCVIAFVICFFNNLGFGEVSKEKVIWQTYTCRFFFS